MCLHSVGEGHKVKPKVSNSIITKNVFGLWSRHEITSTHPLISIFMICSTHLWLINYGFSMEINHPKSSMECNLRMHLSCNINLSQ